MSKAKPEHKERYVQRQIVLWLRKLGWLVINSSGAWRSARGMTGFPDLICHFRGFTIYVECKSYGATLRDTQLRFLQKLRPHIGTHLEYMSVEAGQFDIFVKKIFNMYQYHKWDIPKKEFEWRPKHDSLI